MPFILKYSKLNRRDKFIVYTCYELHQSWHGMMSRVVWDGVGVQQGRTPRTGFVDQPHISTRESCANLTDHSQFLCSLPPKTSLCILSAIERRLEGTFQTQCCGQCDNSDLAKIWPGQ